MTTARMPAVELGRVRLAALVNRPENGRPRMPFLFSPLKGFQRSAV